MIVLLAVTFGCLEQKDFVAHNDRAYLNPETVRALANDSTQIIIHQTSDVGREAELSSVPNYMPILNLRNLKPVTKNGGYNRANWGCYSGGLDTCWNFSNTGGTCEKEDFNYPVISSFGCSLPQIDSCNAGCVFRQTEAGWEGWRCTVYVSGISFPIKTRIYLR